MAGLRKRPPEYVPPEFRQRLDKLSKADLMEITWSFAQMIYGAEDQPGEKLVSEIRREYETLAHNFNRRPVKI